MCFHLIFAGEDALVECLIRGHFGAANCFELSELIKDFAGGELGN